MLLGEKLKKARKNIGMSQNEVAEELMLSRQTISKWENNVCLPDLENFQRICKLYKVDFNTILSKDEGKIIYNIDKSEKEEEDTKEIDIRYRHYLIPFFFLKVLLDKKRRKRVCKKYILLLITPSVRAASVRWMPVSGPSTSEAWTGIDEKIQRPQSKELANNFLNFIKCPPFTF